MFDDSPWDVNFDQRFQDTVEDLDTSSGDLKNNVSKTVNAVVNNPLKGDPKTGQLRGCRTTHIEHLVLIWELDPEIISIEHLDDLKEIYFLNLKHHDKMLDGIAAKSPVEFNHRFTVTFESLDVQATISKLYDCDEIHIEDQRWEQEGVTINGSIQANDQTLLETRLPETASITLSNPTLLD